MRDGDPSLGPPHVPDAPGWTQAVLHRRGVVAAGGVLVGATTLGGTPWGRELLAAIADPDGEAARVLRRASGTVVERIRRDADQLVLDLVHSGLDEVVTGRTVTLRASGPQPGYLGFVLPAQALGEATTHGATALSPASPAVKTELGGVCLLAFSVPVGAEIGYDIASLLDWSGLQPKWDGAGRSLIEAPYRFSVRPSGTTVWRHDPEPRVLLDAGGRPVARTELWHTRLGVPSNQHRSARLRVVGTYATGLKLAVDATDRAAIRALADTDTVSSSKAPVVADEFVLSSLGASVDLHGRWPKSAGSLVSWDHRTTLGRDQYVKTVNRGYLMPWGHPAVLVEETWRRMRLRGTGSAARPAAVLEKTITLVVTDPVVDTEVVAARTINGTTGGSRLPFRSVRCTVRTSPPLRERELSTLKNSGGLPFLAETGVHLRLPFVGLDWEGREVPLSSVVGFLPAGLEKKPGIVVAWNSAEPAEQTVDLGGRQVALVPSGGAPGSTSMQVGTARTLIAYVKPEVSGPLRRAPFRPVFSTLEVAVPAVSALASTQGTAPAGRRAEPAATTHTWPAAYVKDQNNKGGVYLRPKTPIGAPSGPDLTGGLGSLPQVYQGLSTKVGAVLAASQKAFDQLADGVSTASQIYDDLTLFGRIPLAEIIVDGGLGALPTAITTVVEQRQTVTTKLTPKLTDYQVGPVRFFPGALTIVATLAAGGPRPPERSIDARLSNATLELAGLVRLPIQELHITSSSAAPFDLTLTLGDLAFLGPLAFVQQLAEVLAPFVSDARPSTSYRSAGHPANAGRATLARRGLDPDVDVDLQGLHVSQAIALPDVQVGVFRLAGLGFGFGLDLLFAGGLGGRFDFATHENPFQVSYGPFGGGGYCALALDAGGVTDLEVSLMACGGVGINLGVAAGAISVSAGLVLSLPAKQPVSLTGFFRASGALEVLGLVSVSVVFEIALTFVDSDPVSLTGTAELALKVEVCWVSKTVKASVQKTFTGGAQKKPIGGRAARAGASDEGFTYRDAYPDDRSWQSYADAYAPGA